MRSDLELEVGRSEVRVMSAAFPLEAGQRIQAAGVVERLQRLGYRRVRGRRPERVGEYFWGFDHFWIFRRRHRLDHEIAPALFFGLALERDSGKAGGKVIGLLRGDGSALDPDLAYLEPELLAESLRPNRSARVLIELDELPEHVWRSVLAAEDARFFEHPGVDSRSVARALLRNAKAGKVAEGGSTITQQLIKNRDLTPKRTLGRKVSEAFRALAIEAEHDKQDILQAYLNSVYLGHVGGVAVHGIGAAAEVYFSAEAGELGLAESSALAAMIQGPNRLSPVRNPEAVIDRQSWVLSRLEELGWESAENVARAQARALRSLDLSPAPASGPRHALLEIARTVEQKAADRVEDGRGFVISLHLDPWIQARTEKAVVETIGRLRRGRDGLSAAALVADASQGAIRSWVGGDPGARDDFDRVRRARRQPGSAVKPFVFLEAVDRCGGAETLHLARRLLDQPLEIELDGDTWQPENIDREFRGPVTVRESLTRSLNVPTVRLARHCGFEAVAERFGEAGLALPQQPPSFVLGAIEVSPLELLEAYTTFALGGRRRSLSLLERVTRPGGRRIRGIPSQKRHRRVARESSTYLIRDVLEQAARRAGVDIEGAWGKTGTSSDQRDAWFVGGVGELVALVWVGRDDGRSIGLTGTAAAAPIWREVMTAAAGSYRVGGEQTAPKGVPKGVVTRDIDSATGLRVARAGSDTEREFFRRAVEPPRKRWYRSDPPEPVIE